MNDLEKSKEVASSLMSFGSEFWVAIAGAVVGGMIAVLAQWMFEYLKERKRAKKTGTVVFFKMLKICTNTQLLRNYIEKCFSEIDPNIGSHPCSVLRPLVGPPEKIYFSPEEVSLIASKKEDSLVVKIMDSEACYNNLLVILEKYSNLREEFYSSQPSELVGNLSRTEYKDEVEYKSAQVTIAILDDMAKIIRERAHQDLKESSSYFIEVSSFLKNHIGLNFKIKLDTTVTN